MKYSFLLAYLIFIFLACKSKVENNDNKNSQITKASDSLKNSLDTVKIIATDDTNSIVSPPPFLKPFILPQHTILKVEKGDLNNDKLEDYIVILEDLEGEGQSARPVLLITQNADATYQLAARNDSIVGCKKCGGSFDPLAGITIKNSFFTLEQEGGSRERWTNYITFRYDSNRKTWILHRIDETGIDTLDANDENISQKVRTAKNFGTVLFTDFRESHF